MNETRHALVTKMLYRDELGRKYHQYTISYEDGSGEYVRVPLEERVETK